MRWLYTALARPASIVASAVALWRGCVRPAYRTRLRERYGFGEPGGGTRPIWIHAVSVGEVQAAVALVDALAARLPGRPLLLTTTTPTGHERARAVAAARPRLALEVRYAPYDLPGAVRRFLARTRPALGIVLETELWPNLAAGCAAASVPLVLVSARISQRSVRRYLRFAPALMQATVRRFALIVAQGTADAGRFVTLGADAARVHVGGNVKFDFTLPGDLPARATALRTRYGELGVDLAHRPVWVAGSTHPAEEAELLAAHGSVSAGQILVLAPRHPQRFGEVAAWLVRSGVRFVRHSQPPAAGAADADVLLLDTLGELLGFYALAQVAFVGGTLVPVGGHNLLEPAALGLPVLAGPHTFNAPQVARELIEAGAARIVHGSQELGRELALLFADPAERARRGECGLAALEANRGAVARSLDLLRPLLPDA